MNFKEFGYRVEAVVEFTADELAQLAEWSRKHYDGKCKAAAEVGGVLYGMQNMLFGKPVGDITVKMGDMDLLCKIAEAETAYAMLGSRPCLGDVGFKLSSIFKKMIAEHKRINNIAEWKAP